MQEIYIPGGSLKNQKFSIQVQGNQVKQLEDILVERYKVPKKYIHTEDNTNQGKKKKK